MATIHVVPIGETDKHTRGKDCKCVPLESDHNGGLLVIHIAFDNSMNRSDSVKELLDRPMRAHYMQD